MGLFVSCVSDRDCGLCLNDGWLRQRIEDSVAGPNNPNAPPHRKAAPGPSHDGLGGVKAVVLPHFLPLLLSNRTVDRSAYDGATCVFCLVPVKGAQRRIKYKEIRRPESWHC